MQIKISKTIAYLVFAAALVVPGAGRANQPRDWMVGAQKGGTYLNVDAVFPGAQLLIEHRVPVHGQMNELDLRANSLVTAIFYESQADIDMRLVVATFGASLGYRDTFRGMTFEPEEPLDRAYRRKRDFAGDIEHMSILYGEGRVNVSIPFNDYLVWHNINSLRYEDRPDRSFDWRLGVVHDGFYLRSDFHLFIKHREFGALAPMVQLINFGLDGERNTLLNYGFFFVTRPGFRRRDDIFLFTMLFNFGKTLGDYDGHNIYGIHNFHAPLTFILAYRMVFDLGG